MIDWRRVPGKLITIDPSKLNQSLYASMREYFVSQADDLGVGKRFRQTLKRKNL